MSVALAAVGSIAHCGGVSDGCHVRRYWRRRQDAPRQHPLWQRGGGNNADSHLTMDGDLQIIGNVHFSSVQPEDVGLY